MMELKRIQKSELLMAVLRVFVYGGIFLCFFGLMSINNFQMRRPSRTLAVTLLTFVAMAFAMNAVYGGYAVGKKKSKPVISSMSLSVIITDVVTYLEFQIMNVNSANHQRLEIFNEDFPLLLLCIVLQVALIVFWVRLGNNMFFKINPPQKCCLITGPGTDHANVMRKIGRYKLQYRVDAVVDSQSTELKKVILDSDTVFMCGVPEDRRNSVLTFCYQHRKNVLCLAQMEDIMVSNAKQVILDDAPFLEMEYRTLTTSQRFAKRTLDLAVSIPAVVILSPILLAVALAIKLDDGGPVFFRQKRATLNGEVFRIFKFRTMSSSACNAKVQVSASSDDARITRVGQFLRKIRVDELPQLFNVIKGEMSLVGPRPEMMENVTKYKQELPAFAYREKMKAGITGYAQIEGKYNTTPQDKLMLDLTYIESYSVWLDIKLLFRTLTVFFKPDSTEGFQPAPQTDEKKTLQG